MKVLWDTIITLYMLNTVTGDVHRAIVSVGQKSSVGTLGSGRQTSELCLP